MISVNFKVFGKVQGSYTQAKARELGLFGYVKNEFDGTVVGIMQGIESSVREMKVWLETKGSPQSSIQKVEFTNEKIISKPDYDSFTINK
ncbi:acylphosphatase-2-like protein 1 [Sarcoptes scabiei]|uniref:acylphosphatase n=1 Tax=Sarcoptes scabiei TaxID=52283 RepID=A0A132A4J4_SARSC|nr:acylphosphatase-2-like protein 1 [Sarcoptes scabiei]